MPKTLAEIRKLALARNLDDLDGLSETDLNVLLATLKKKKIPLKEEMDFRDFYPEVVTRLRSPAQPG